MIQHTAAFADTANDIHRNAYNAAFYELGLGWHWDAEIYGQLQPLSCNAERIRSYLQTYQSHLLTAYEPGFLAEAIEAAKSRCFALMTASGAKGAGKADWAALHSPQIGH